MADEYSHYEFGLAQMKRLFTPSHPQYSTLMVYEQRLTENLAATRRFGGTESRRAERAEVISRLDDLAQRVLRRSFQSLANPDPSESPALPPATPAQGVQISGGTVYGPVIGVNQGTVNSQYGETPTPATQPAAAAQPVDIVLITAMPDELEPLLNLGGGKNAWIPVSIDRYQYYRTELQTGTQTLKVVAGTMGKYGAEETVAAVQRLASLKPKLLAMTGICAGLESAVALGDVIIADRAFRAQEGKRTDQGFEADTQTYQPPGWLLQPLREFARDTHWHETISVARPHSLRYQREWLLCKLSERGPEFPASPADYAELKQNRIELTKARASCQKHNWIDSQQQITPEGTAIVRQLREANYGVVQPRPDPAEPKAHVGAFASTVDVIAISDPFAEYLSRVRKALAIELEAHALLSTAANLGLNAVLVKGVSDYASPEKDDSWQAYAAEASARWLYAFLSWYAPRLQT